MKKEKIDVDKAWQDFQKMRMSGMGMPGMGMPGMGMMDLSSIPADSPLWNNLRPEDIVEKESQMNEEVKPEEVKPEVNIKTFQEYQQKAYTFALIKTDLAYAALGLNGEAGEVAEKVKKIIRDKGGKIDDNNRTQIANECGDVLWYLSLIANILNVNLYEIAGRNILKLQDRKERGKLHGSGDNR